MRKTVKGNYLRLEQRLATISQEMPATQKGSEVLVPAIPVIVLGRRADCRES